MCYTNTTNSIRINFKKRPVGLLLTGATDMKLGFPSPLLAKSPIMGITTSKTQMAITTPSVIRNGAKFPKTRTVWIAMAYIQNAVIRT